MYSRSQNGRGEGAIRLPDHYSGVAFDRTRPVEFCADGLPQPRLPEPPPTQPEGKRDEETHGCDHDRGHDEHSGDHCDRCDSCGHPDGERHHRPEPPLGEGLLGAIGGEELLLLGVIFLLAQRQGEDDTILLLLLLLLRR